MSDEWKSNKPPNVINEISGARLSAMSIAKIDYGNGLEEGKCLNECNSDSCMACESCNTCECVAIGRNAKKFQIRIYLSIRTLDFAVLLIVFIMITRYIYCCVGD